MFIKLDGIYLEWEKKSQPITKKYHRYHKSQENNMNL